MDNKPFIQHLDRVVREVASRHDGDKFIEKMEKFLMEIMDEAPSDVGELRIYDLQMAIWLVLRA
jgi:hypothetical protein